MWKTHIEEKKASSTAVLEKLGIHAKGTELDPHLSHCTKINTKLSKELYLCKLWSPNSVRTEHRDSVSRERYGKDFLRRTGAAKETNSRMDKWSCEVERFLLSKENNLAERPQRGQEGIFASYRSGRSLTPRLYKGLKPLNTPMSKKTTVISEMNRELTERMKCKQSMSK